MNEGSPDHNHPRIRPGPIRNESLPPEMLEQIRAVYDVIGSYVSMSLEQFEIGFMRDANPSDEVAIWFSITAAWLAYHEQHLSDELLPDEEEKKLLSALIVISTGETNTEHFGVPDDIGRKLLACYDALGNS